MRCVREFGSSVINNCSIFNTEAVAKVNKIVRQYDNGLLTEVDAMDELVKIARDDAYGRAQGKFGIKADL